MSKLKSVVLVAIIASGGLVYSRVTASAQDVHPVVDVQESCLIGGVAGGRWLDAEHLTPMLKGGERYSLYTLTKRLGEVVGSNTESAGAPCEETRLVKLSPEAKEGIAVAGGWNALPRVPRVMRTNDPVYRQVIAGVLRKHGFLRPQINITQILRVDLDNDGTEEVLVSATHLAEGLSVNGGPMAVHAKPGDYSLVLLRQVVQGKARDIVLVEGYYPRKTSEGWTPEQHEVAAVLDLDGDGRMEIIIHGQYYEGSWSTVFRLDGSKATNVFSCGCGA